MNTKAIRILAIMAAVALLIGGVWWSYHSAYKRGYNAAVSQLEKQAVKQQAKAIETERQANDTLQTKLEKIEHEKQQTVAANQSMRSELERLQEYINARKLPTSASSTSESESDAIARGWALFGQCAKEYAGMAEVADNQRDSLAQWQAYGEVVESMEK